MNENTLSRCGYVAVIGAPNAGKSTLVNQMVGTKVSIVSAKVQTTRNRILGILIRGETQIILIDTPGLFLPKTRLDRAMVSAAWSGADEADIILYLYDARKKSPDEADLKALGKLAHMEGKSRVMLALNKSDAVPPQRLLELAASLNALCPFAETYMISALNGDGVEDLLIKLAHNLPESPWLFEEDQITDMPWRMLAAEITREQIFNQLHQELPYGMTVETESWEEFENGSVKINQVIHIEREAHKGIVLGKGGSKLKQLGTAAREELEKSLSRKVHLKLFVRVSGRWREDPEYFAQWGLDHKA
jgi:GTP-binding protein Era